VLSLGIILFLIYGRFSLTKLIRGFIEKLGLNKTMRSKIKRKLNLICAQNFIYYKILKRENHGSCEKIFLDTMRGWGGEGFLAFFWPKFSKNVAGEGRGGGVKIILKRAN
jgi:hypothetical protein